MMYLLLGEMGYEIAQSNAAYILEEGLFDYYVYSVLSSCGMHMCVDYLFINILLC